MDGEVIGAKSCAEESLVQLSPPKVEGDISKDEDDESNSLLLVQKGQAPRRPCNPQRKVQWNDRNGHKLVEILEFQPSDSSDSDEEYDSDNCICAIM